MLGKYSTGLFAGVQPSKNRVLLFLIEHEGQIQSIVIEANQSRAEIFDQPRPIPRSVIHLDGPC